MTTLRDYQTEGYNEIIEAWDAGHDLVMFTLATGGGKTVTFVELIKRAVLAGRRVVLIAHREELITQAWNTLYRNNIYAGIIMAGYPENFALAVQVCSIQTIQRRRYLPHADEVYIDEGHHAQRENTYGKVMAQFWPGAKYLIVTATPYRLSGEGFLHLHPYKPTKLLVNRTLPQLVEEGWLVPLRYMIASIPDLQDVSISKGEYELESAQKAMELAPLVESYLDHVPGKSGITFAINVAHSIHICSQYHYAGVPAEHLDANTPDDERKRIITDFRAGLVKVICNVGILTEGADFPDCEFIQLARPTKSLSLYLQMIGRVTRPQAGIVDGIARACDRRNKIAQSRKPAGFVLDNAGAWIDNMPPDHPHNWEQHFVGRKKAKKKEDEEMEMLVFVAEDKTGRVVRSTSAKEVEGMKLIEITRENRRKVINVTSIKEFDRLFAIFRNQRHMKKPAYAAYREFRTYATKNNILLVDEIWDYLLRRLALEPRDQRDALARNRSLSPGAYPLALYEKAVEDINRLAVSEQFLKTERSRYEADNQKEVIEARFGYRVPESGKLNL